MPGGERPPRGALITFLDHAAHVVVEGLVGLLGLGFIAGCVLAWRLAQGPIDISGLVRRELPGLTASGARLAIGRASLAWEGFFASDSPIDIRLDDITLAAPNGAPLLTLPHGRVTLSLIQLLRGRTVPRTVELDDAVVSLLRTKNGLLQLDVGRGSGGAGNTVLTELAQPARGGTTVGGPLPWLSQLRAVHIRGAAITVKDAVLGLVWQARAANADLQRRPDGGVAGHAALDLAVGAVRAQLTADATLTAEGTAITARSTAVNPATLAGAALAFAPLRAVNAPMELALSASLGPDLAPRMIRLSITAGAGAIAAGSGSVAIRAAAADIEATSNSARVTKLSVVLAAPPGARAPPPTLTGTAEGKRADGRIAAQFALHVDRAAFADLAAYWPRGTGGGGRPWVIENITTGMAHDADVQGSIAASGDFSDITLTSLSGGVAADGMTLWWLRPITPLTGVAAKLVIDGPDAIRVLVTGGAQGRLRLDGGVVRITGLTAKDQIGDIAADISGALPDALALLNTRRLALLSRFPVSFTDPAGALRTKLKLRLPLDVHVTMDDIAISANANMTGVRLRQVAAGRDLTDGRLKLAVDTHKLDIDGTATVADIPAAITFFEDFRAGPADQVLERITARGTAPASDWAAAGAPAAYLAGGSASLAATYVARRNNTASADLAADLTQAVLATPAGWSKPAGQKANASAQLLLTNGRITAVNQLRADGPGLMLRGQAEAGDRARTLYIQRALVGRTDLHGSVALPMAGGAPIRVALAGPALDISPFLKESGSEPATSEKSGPSWDATLSFGQVILGREEAIASVSLVAASDGRRITQARLDAAGGSVQASITPAPGGRKLAITSDDSGEVLRAAGVADNIRGGRLRVEGNYADAEPHAPLSGSATLDQFRVTDAPAMGRLLKALTLYGAVDLLRGPGLGFARAVVPFRWRQRILTLESARAYSASLGLTAKGEVDFGSHTADLAGTIVPAYFFNTLLGHLPFVGRLFSPEKGGGVFAARYTLRGRLADPKVGVNPLSVLTPGFLRGLFGPG